MLIKYGLLVLGLIILAAVAIVRVNGWRLEKNLQKMVGELNQAVASPPANPLPVQELENLPLPVQRYFRKVLPSAPGRIRRVELYQNAIFRLDERRTKGFPLQARQFYTTEPPGFLWDARIRMAPLITVRVLDAYLNGKGVLQAHLMNTLKVAEAFASRELDSGELLRWLAEAVWFPTALLPSTRLHWQAVDERSARAILTDGPNEVSLVFHFKISGEIVRATGQRYRMVDGAYLPTLWSARYWDYQRREGMLIPLQGEVAWDLPEGQFVYWKGKIERIAYQY